jgi:hypothetical protein
MIIFALHAAKVHNIVVQVVAKGGRDDFANTSIGAVNDNFAECTQLGIHVELFVFYLHKKIICLQIGSKAALFPGCTSCHPDKVKTSGMIVGKKWETPATIV